jgi:hypothetical protein
MKKFTWPKIDPTNLTFGIFLGGSVHAVALFYSALVLVGPLIMLGYFAADALKTYKASLLKRSKNNDPTQWDVELNGVKVGTINDATYAGIRLQLFSDKALYAAQARNLLTLCSNIALKMFTAIPAYSFWFAVLLFLFFPEKCASAWAELQTMSAESVAKFVVDHIPMAIAVLGLAAACVTPFYATSLGFINKFGEATAKALRSRFGVAAPGRFTLTRDQEGMRIIETERFSLISDE